MMPQSNPCLHQSLTDGFPGVLSPLTEDLIALIHPGVRFNHGRIARTSTLLPKPDPRVGASSLSPALAQIEVEAFEMEALRVKLMRCEEDLTLKLKWLKFSLLYFDFKNSPKKALKFQELFLGIPITQARNQVSNLKLLNRAIQKSAQTADYLKSCQGTGHLSIEMLKIHDLELGLLAEDYIQEFGNRALGELKPETRTLHQEPHLLLEQLNGISALRDFPRRENTNPPLFDLFKRIQNWLLSKVIHSLHDRERIRQGQARSATVIRNQLLEIGMDWVSHSLIEEVDDIFFIRWSELCLCPQPKSDFKQAILDRRAKYQDDLEREFNEKTRDSNPHFLQGKGCAGGIQSGEVLCIRSPEDYQKNKAQLKGRIVAIQSIDPGSIFELLSMKGLITEAGSLSDRTATFCREYGIPSIFGVPHLLSSIQSGEWVQIDSSTGKVNRLPKAKTN